MERAARRYFRLQSGRPYLLPTQTHRRDLSFASSAGKKDPLKFNESLLRDCWLGGSEAIRRDDDKFMGASGLLEKIIPDAEAELEKL